MQPIDYCTLLDTADPMPGTELAQVVYRNRDGIQFRARKGLAAFVHEGIRLREEAFLFATACVPEGRTLHEQIVRDTDGIHVQFRFRGDGYESVSCGQRARTPEQSCIVSRYPRNCIVEREISAADQWKYVCLYLSPSGLTKFTGISMADLPSNLHWLADTGALQHTFTVVPLRPAMTLAANDILSCNFRGASRVAYMRSKALELLATIIHALDVPTTVSRRRTLNLSSVDITKLASAREMMSHNLENNMTLAQLARQVDLNRTKLALGFKEIYGQSVQAFWRDIRLIRAKELLEDRETSITDVAFSLGYSELSSFTRAFIRKFGVLPRECRKQHS